MKFTFVAEEENIPYSGYTARKSTVEFKADDLSTLLSNFEDFLKGLGYQIDGMLDVVKDDETWDYDEKKNNPNANDYSFDTHDNNMNMSSSWPFATNNVFSTINLGTAYETESDYVVHGSNVNLDVINLGAAQPTLDISDTFKNSMDNIEISLNNQHTYSSENLGAVRVCSVCRLTERQLKNFKCFDPNCGLKD